MIILLYGLSGSGKTTLAKELSKIEDRIILDGDDVRNGLNDDLGFSLEDRKENIRRVCETAKLLNSQGFSITISVICPTEEMRQMAKEILGDDLYMVYLSTPLEVCMERDTKGLYAEKGSEMTGIGSPFEEALTYDLKIDTSDKTIRECVNLIRKEAHNFERGTTLEVPQQKAMKRYNQFLMGNTWMINAEHKFAYPVIAKCASTQMRNWCFSDNMKHRQHGGTDGVLPSVTARNLTIDDVPSDYVKFAIYRDPIERFYSACHYPGYDAKEVIKELSEYTFDNGVCKDQHMRRQSDFYNIEDVDYIVKLSDLNDFLSINFGRDNSHGIVKHPVFEDVDLTLSDEEMEYIKSYYAKDWDILKSDKVWQKPSIEEQAPSFPWDNASESGGTEDFENSAEK